MEAISASEVIESGSHEPRLRRADKAAKSPIWTAAEPADALVLAYLDRKLRAASGVAFGNRHRIIRDLNSALGSIAHGVVVRTDFHRCYNSIAPELAYQTVRSTGALTQYEESLLHRYIAAANENGLPWGIAPSNTIAEIILSQFEQRLRGVRSVLHIGRFVDDIVIVADSSNAAILQQIRDLSPPGLIMNSTKTQFVAWEPSENERGAASFDYLGYRITNVSDSGTQWPGRVQFELAPEIMSSLKQRIRTAIGAFRCNGRLSDLRDRIRLITGNIIVRCPDGGAKRRLGLRLSFPNLTDGVQLRQLDAFLRYGLAVVKNRIPKDDHSQRLYRELCRGGFSTAYRSNQARRWPLHRLRRLQSAWN